MRRGRKRARAIRLKRSRLRRKSKADACADGQKPAGWLAGLGTLRLASRHQIHGGASAGERAWHLDATSAPHGRRRKRSFLTGFLAPCTLCANPTVVGRSLARPLRPFKWHGPFTYRSLLSWATSVGAKWLTIEDRNAGEKQKSGRKIADRFVYVRECACVWGGGGVCVGVCVVRMRAPVLTVASASWKRWRPKASAALVGRDAPRMHRHCCRSTFSGPQLLVQSSDSLCQPQSEPSWSSQRRQLYAATWPIHWMGNVTGYRYR